MNNHSFDDQIRQKASGHEAPVPAGTWEAIAQKKKKRRRFPLFWWITGATLLSAGIILFIYNNGSGSKNKLAATGTASTGTAGAGTATNLTTKTTDKKETIQKDNDSPVQATATQSNPVNDVEQVQGQVAATIPAAVPATPLVSTLVATVPQESSGKASATFTVRPASVSSSRASKNTINNTTASTNEQKEINTEIASPSSVDLITETGISSFTIGPPVLSNYDNHDQIAEFSPEKQLKTDSKLVIKDADSILDRVDAIIAATAKKLSKKNKWTVDISVMPFLPVQQNQSLLYLTRTRTEAMQTAEYKTDRISTHLQPSLAYTISVSKRVNPRLRIGAGLQYALVKEKVDLSGKETRVTYTEVDRLINGSSGPQLIKDTVENTSTGTLTIDALNSYRFISIPISVQYRLMQRRSWSLQLNAGLLINISAKYHNSIEGNLVRYSNQGMHTSQQKSGPGLDVFAGLRLSKSLRSFSVFAEPILRYNMRRYDLSGMINRKSMHQAGLSLGLSYTLRY
jgi:hypothetical protein